MKTPNRDLLVLVKDEFLNNDDMEFELEKLNQLLLSFETMDKFCVAHEIFDMNKFKIIHDSTIIQRIIKQKDLKPFEFICNKN
jgi:hypothetical protein